MSPVPSLGYRLFLMHTHPYSEIPAPGANQCIGAAHYKAMGRV